MPISIDQWHVAVGLFGAQICCYHQKNDLEIFKFKSLNYVFLQGYNFSTFAFGGPACMVILRLIQDSKKSSNQNILHVVIGMSTVYWLITKYPCSVLTAYYTIHQNVICISQRHSLIPSRSSASESRLYESITSLESHI